MTSAFARAQQRWELARLGAFSAERAFEWLRGLALVLVSGVALIVTPQLGIGNEAYTVGKVLVLGVLALVALSTLLPARALRIPLAGWLLAAYWLHGVASALTGAQPLSMSSLALLPELCAGVVMAATAFGTRDEPARRALVLDAIVVAATLMSLVALAEALGVSLPWAGARRPHSTLGNRNFVGAEAAIAAAIAWGRCLARPSALKLAGLSVLIAAVGLSRCRSAWLGVFVAAIVSCGAVWLVPQARAKLTRRNLRRPALATAAAVGALLAVALLPWPGLRWTDSASPMSNTLARMTEYQKGTGRERLADLSLAAVQALEHPILGVGPRGWDDAASSRAHLISGRHATPQHFWATPNSDLARTLGERGILGLGLLLAAIGAVAEATWRGLRSPRWHEHLPLVAPLSVFAVNAALDAPLFRPSSLLLAALLLGVTGNWRGAKPLRVPAFAWRGGLLLLAILIATGTSLRVVAATTIARAPDDPVHLERAQALFWRSDVAEVLTLKLARAGRCSEAESVGAEAMSVSPHHWGVPHALAGCFHERGDLEQARAFARRRDEIEPHVAALFRDDADLASGYEREGGVESMVSPSN